MKIENQIEKLSWNSYEARIFTILMTSIPLWILLFFTIFNFAVPALIFTVITFILLLLQWYYSVLNWDLYISNDKFILRRWFHKTIIVDICDVKVSGLGFLTMFYRLFKIEINNDRYYVVFRLKSQFELFNAEKVEKRIENYISEEIDKRKASDKNNEMLTIPDM